MQQVKCFGLHELSTWFSYVRVLQQRRFPKCFLRTNFSYALYLRVFRVEPVLCGVH
jgi:hypothetical protein